MVGIDEKIKLGTGKLTTLRQLAHEVRLVLRRSGSYAEIPGVTDPRKALWADVVHPNNPNSSDGFEITQDDYDTLLALGVPDATLPGAGGLG